MTAVRPLGLFRFFFVAGESSSLASPGGLHKPLTLPPTGGVCSACGLKALEMHRWGMGGWDGSPSQAATVPGYSLGLQCSHSASAPTRSHLTRQLGSWGASELRAEAGIGPEARIALPHRPFANAHEYVHACTAVQERARVARSTVAKHPPLGPEQRPCSGNPSSLALVSAMLIGPPAGPCIPACLNPWPRPPPSFSLGPIISFHLSNAMQSMPACWPLLVCRLDEP